MQKGGAPNSEDRGQRGAGAKMCVGDEVERELHCCGL